MTGGVEHVKSRVEIDARARAARLALERDAVMLGGVPHRLVALRRAVAALWRRLAGSWPEVPTRSLRGPIDGTRSGGARARH